MISVVIFLPRQSEPVKMYDISAVQDEMLRFYEDRGLRSMDFVDIRDLFGINVEDSQDAIYLSNVDREKGINSESMLIVVMNTDKPSYFYSSFRSHLDSYTMYSEDKEILDLYDKAILVEGDNFIYFIIDKEASIIEKEINMYYKEA